MHNQMGYFFSLKIFNISILNNIFRIKKQIIFINKFINYFLLKLNYGAFILYFDNIFVYILNYYINDKLSTAYKYLY